MVSIWWLIAMNAAWLIIAACLKHIAYRQGIWDGAFNHFLPVVRTEMMAYDSYRAKKILDTEDAELGVYDELGGVE